MSRPLRTALLAALFGVLTCLSARDARAFCGFYVSGADTKLLAEATQVVLMREGTRTVLSMQNDYKGPPEGFAMVVPVPVVLQEENVKTLRRDVFDRVDRLSAPRLVEYWEQDPCPKDADLGGVGAIGHGGGGTGQGFGAGAGRVGGGVVIEARFEVGEYEIVILSAKDSSGLDTWLRENKYKIPENAEPVLRPYVQAGSKFFVAKVDVAKVKLENGRATLSPLRFHYDSERFELPVRLGMLNSSGTQDLVVHVLAPNQRYVVANYPNVTIPTNLDVSEAARKSFSSFYAALFDRTLEKSPGAIVTEYAWPSSSCDPCPGGVSGLSNNDLATLGADVLPSTRADVAAAAARSGPPSVTMAKPTTSGGKLSADAIHAVVSRNLGAVRLCYEKALLGNANLSGRVQTKIDIDASGAVVAVSNAGSDIPDAEVIACVGRVQQRLVFPKSEDAKATAAVTTFIMNTPPPAAGVAPGGAGLARGGRLGAFRSVAGSFVLTRLHARYGKDTLGSDLVFKAAPGIVGGREVRGEKGALETGATPAAVSSFQARYAIRHEWTGAITCKEPRRGVWGGPWRDAGSAPSGPAAPIAAQKLAYAARDSVTLASFVPNGVPELAVAPGAPGAAGAAAPADAPLAAATTADASASDASADAGTSSPRASRCGCRVVGLASTEHAACGAVVLAIVALARRRRTRARARTRPRA
jgi:hypothetical protein